MKNGKLRHFFLPAVLIAAVLFSLTGCGLADLFGKPFDASRYVKGCLDASTKGVFEDYVAMTNSTEEEAKKEYEDRMNSEVDAMTGSITMSDEMKDRYLKLYKDIYSKYKYEVGEAVEGENKSFSVPVKTYRLTIFKETIEETQKELEKKVEELIKKKKTPSTDETMQLYVEILADALEEKLANPQYGEEQTINVNLSVNSSTNEYEISSADVTTLFAALDDVDEAK